MNTKQQKLNRLTLDPSDSNVLTTQSIQDKQNKYKHIERDDDGYEIGEKDDLALTAYTKQFKGLCRNCEDAMQHIAKTSTKELVSTAMNLDIKFIIVISSYKLRRCSMEIKVQIKNERW